jgi:hypothetical protein
MDCRYSHTGSGFSRLNARRFLPVVTSTRYRALARNGPEPDWYFAVKLAKLLFKPKWQDSDAAVRRSAIASAVNDPELSAALPEMARRDADASVRLAALQRLGDYEAWRERSTGDNDASVRSAAREAYVSMLCSGLKGAPPVARRIAELETLSEDEIERVAASAAEVALRREASTRVTKQIFLAQRAAADADATLRLELVERVGDTTLLERIAERTRKTDKAVSRRARARLQSFAIATGDAAAIAERARSLCERLENLMRAPHDQTAAELAAIQSEWQALGNAVPAPLAARFHGASGLILKALAPRPVTPPEPVAPVIEPPPPQPAPNVAPPAPRIDEHAAERARVERARQKTLQHEFENRLKEFSESLEAGDSTAAHRLHARVDEMRVALAEVPHALRELLERLQARYAELKQWQHWSNNQRRRTLCADIEGLIGSGLHPDAVATRVHDAREEWQRLNVTESVTDGTEAAAGLAHRFHAVCARALRPTRAYFAKRKEVRQTHAQEIEALVARAGAIADDSNDWKTIAEIQSQASRALRALDGVEPRLRTELAARLKNVIARMAALAGAHEAEVESAKTRLITQAAALVGSEHAVREVRELQKRWTALGNGRRATDQKQWREFRAACDAVFGKLDEVRKQREEASAEARAQIQSVLDDYTNLAAVTSDDLEDVRRRLRELDARWSAVANDDRAAVKRQRELRDAIALRIKNFERRKRLSRFHAALQRYAALAADPAADLQTLTSAAEFDASLAVRQALVQAGASSTPDDADARGILVRLEFLAGVESPDEDRQLRMNHQVQRLSSRMREGANVNPERELSDLLQQWFAQAPQLAMLEERFAAAANAAVESLP